MCADREIPVATAFLAESTPSPKKTCCGVDLRVLPVIGYEHEGGYVVEGLHEYYKEGPLKGYPIKQWLYVVCPVCGYQMSFEHMGIPRYARIDKGIEPVEGI